MWVGRAKQLWLTTPLAMKSPVPVVMSYIGISRPSGLDGHDAQIGVGLDRVVLGDLALAGDRRIDEREEAEVLAQAAGHPHVCGRRWRLGGSSTEVETEMIQAGDGPSEDLVVGVGDPK